MVRLRSALFDVVDRLSRAQKQVFLLLIDVALAPLALIVSALVLYSLLPAGAALERIAPVLPLGAVIAGLCSAGLGMPLIRLNAYESQAILRTGVLALIVTLLTGAVAAQMGAYHPTTGMALFGMIYFLLLVMARITLLHTLLWVLRQGKPRRRVLIYGAGTTGAQLAAALTAHQTILPVGFIDDNPSMQGMTLGGLRIHGSDRIEDLARTQGVDRVLLAMPSVSAPKLHQIARRLQDMGLAVMSVPSFAQLVGVEQLLDNLTPVQPLRFLGRRQVDGSPADGAEAYAGRCVMVTGAGGSVGSELCRQLLGSHPRRIVLVELSEIALYTIDRDLRDLAEGAGIDIVPILGTTTDGRLMRQVMADHGVEVVLHAAAYKHVPLVEANPLMGLANNVLGTRTLAEAAEDARVARFVLISTDKAVRPTNVMGASKRLAELVVQDMARRSRGTLFTMVRFGNVLGSSGSVIPLFKEQIARGGPVTLTHEDVTRYFMTITEAARLVLLAGSYSMPDRPTGGDVYVLDMGRPVRIRDLAHQMIEAAGYTVRDDTNPGGDIDIVVTGLRPGEKLHEELLIAGDFMETPHPKIRRSREDGLSELEIAAVIRGLRAAVARGDADAALAVAQRAVEDYGPARPMIAAQ